MVRSSIQACASWLASASALRRCVAALLNSLLLELDIWGKLSLDIFRTKVERLCLEVVPPQRPSFGVITGRILVLLF